LPLLSKRPTNSKITVILTFLMENWSPNKAPPYSPMTSPPKAGAIDRSGIAWADYGGRFGMARLVRTARRHGVYGTACINARSAELFPETVREIVKAGFEIGGHNYAQDEVLSGLNEQEELQIIRRSLGILETVSGVRPVGWLSSTIATTDITAELLKREGLIWHGDYNNMDQPGRIETPAGPIIGIPHSDYADNRVLRGAPIDWFTTYKDMFDYLYSQEPGSMINITMHGNFGGRPLMAAQFDKLLSYMGTHENVWVPRHDELAAWVDAEDICEVKISDCYA
jgi:allantoinase